MRTFEITFINPKTNKYSHITINAIDSVDANRQFKIAHKKCKIYRIVEKE